MRKIDVGAGIFIAAVASQQEIAHGPATAAGVAGALLLYYGLARLLVWLVIKAVAHFRRADQ